MFIWVLKKKHIQFQILLTEYLKMSSKFVPFSLRVASEGTSFESCIWINSRQDLVFAFFQGHRVTSPLLSLPQRRTSCSSNLAVLLRTHVPAGREERFLLEMGLMWWHEGRWRMPGFQKCSWPLMIARRWKFVLIWLNLIIGVVIWFYGTHFIFTLFFNAKLLGRKNWIKTWYGSGSNFHYEHAYEHFRDKVQLLHGFSPHK